ncbi:MAG: MarR family winged helix-turn-helix transcriptional regulator [Acidimicrobiales bacterium]
MSLRTEEDRASLVARVFELQPLMHRRFSDELQRELRDELNAVTIHQMAVLGVLRDHDSVSMRDLSKQLEVSESASTAVIDRLVRQELVVRKSDPDDRRVVRLSLSGKGRQLLDKVHRAASKKTSTLLAALSDHQLVQLVNILETLRHADLGSAEAQ